MIETEITEQERRNQDGLAENKCCTSGVGHAEVRSGWRGERRNKSYESGMRSTTTAETAEDIPKQ